MIHELKTWPEFFEAIISGDKKFEIRVNDRDFNKGDALSLREYNPETKEYTGRQTTCLVTYVLGEPWAPEGTVIMSVNCVDDPKQKLVDDVVKWADFHLQCIPGTKEDIWTERELSKALHSYNPIFQSDKSLIR
jgi:hypothetical protein